MPNIVGEEKQSSRASEADYSVEKSPDACCLSGEGERAEGDGKCRTHEDMRRPDIKAWLKHNAANTYVVLVSSYILLVCYL